MEEKNLRSEIIDLIYKMSSEDDKKHNFELMEDNDGKYFIGDGVIHATGSYSFDTFAYVITELREDRPLGFVMVNEDVINKILCDLKLGDLKFSEIIKKKEYILSYGVRLITENKLVYACFQDSEILFDYFYENKMYEYLFQFSDKKLEDKIPLLLGESVMNRVLDAIKNDPNFSKEEIFTRYRHSKFVFREYIKDNDFEILDYYFVPPDEFVDELIDVTLPEEVIQKVLSKGYIPTIYKKNKSLLSYLIKNNDWETIFNNMDGNLYTKDVFYECQDYFFNNLDRIGKKCSQNSDALEFILECYFKEVLSNIRLLSGFSKNVKKTCLHKYTDIFFELYKENRIMFYTYVMLEDEFFSELEKIIDSNSGIIFPSMFDCKKLKKHFIEIGRNDLAIQCGFSEDNLDYDISICSEIYGITEESIREKMKNINSKNDEFLKTILPFMFSEKMSVFDENCFNKIIIYPDLQFKLYKLDKHTLQLLSLIMSRLEEPNYDLTGIFIKILNNISIYKTLIDSIEISDLSDNKLLDKLIFVLSNSKNIFSINSIDEVKKIEIMMDKYYNTITSKIENKSITIDELKAAIFLKKYGASIEDMEFILTRYCMNIELLQESNLDFRIYNILKSINEIYETNDFSLLENIYNNQANVVTDFYSTTALESTIRSEFAKIYSDSLYKLNENHKISKHNKTNNTISEKVYDLINNSQYNGVHPEIYYMDGDFNLQIHALGAYRYWDVPENFREDWEKPKIAYHGICTSYIGNNQIANARVRHPVYGFDGYEPSAFLCAGNYDLFSDDVISKYDTGYGYPYSMFLPQDMINNTRHTHNEIVIERRNNINNEIYKRRPSYIVYFVDDVNNKYHFTKKEEVFKELEQKYPDVIDDIRDKYNTVTDIEKAIDCEDKYDFGIELEDLYKIQCAILYEENIQASVDQNIPIVIVDRLKYAKSEKDKCNHLLENFKNTLDIKVLNELLLQTFNNMIGCYNYTGYDLEYYKIFNDNEFDKLFNDIIFTIENVNDPLLGMQLSMEFSKNLFNEKIKRDSTPGGGDECKLMPIDDKLRTVNKMYLINYAKTLTSEEEKYKLMGSDSDILDILLEMNINDEYINDILEKELYMFITDYLNGATEDEQNMIFLDADNGVSTVDIARKIKNNEYKQELTSGMKR